METRALIELLDRHEDVIGRYRIGPQASISIGRSLDCDIVVEDPYTAAHHADLIATASGWTLKLGNSVNGAWYNGQRLPGDSQHDLPPGAEIELGQTHLRLRHPQQSLPPEQALPQDHHQHQTWRRYLPSPRAMLLLALVCAWNLGASWLDSPPDSPWSGYFDELLATVGFAALWGGAWSIINQLFKREMPFWHHIQNGLIAYLVIRFGVMALNTSAYSFSIPVLSHITSVLSIIGFMTACWFSAKRIWPRRQQRAAIALSVVTLLMIVPQTIKLYSNQQRWFSSLYLSTLPPPTLRLVSTVPASTFVQGLDELQTNLAESAQKDNDKSDDSADNEED